jgi:cobalt-zinc-cadmium efflux system protein
MDNRGHTAAPKHVAAAISINAIIVTAEITFGMIARSMALISEALHNFTDIGSMALSWYGEKVSRWPPNTTKTYGYNRAEVIVAFVNGGVFLGVSGWVLIESVMRIFRPEPVGGFVMLVLAGVSLLGNGLATYILGKDSKKNLNLKMAWLHSLQDALLSLVVLAAALVIYYTGWNWVDPVASIIISAYLLKEVYEMLAESVRMLLDSVPTDLDFVEIKSALRNVGGVTSVNDVHIWQTGSHDRFLSAHMITEEMAEVQRARVLAEAIALLKEKYDIRHPAR